MSIDKIRAMKDEYEKTIKAEGKEMLVEEFKTFFAANPEITGVKWQQYTPYFNDGDPCTFSVHEFYFQINESKEGGDYDDGFDSIWGWKYAGSPLKNPEAARDFVQRVAQEDILLAVFGDGVEVTASRDGFQVKEYSHD